MSTGDFLQFLSKNLAFGLIRHAASEVFAPIFYLIFGRRDSFMSFEWLIISPFS